MPPVSFPIKLWNTLNICPNELMRWSDDGTQVFVNEERFYDLVEHFPLFLRQPSLCSLRRLFSLYEFRAEDPDRQKTGWIRYSHPYFIRGHPDLLELFVLSHQTRRYNARKAKPDTEDCKQPKKEGRCLTDEFMRDFVTDIDSKDDLQPICSSSLFQFVLGIGLDDDSSTAEQSPMIIDKQRCSQTENYTSADCSIIIETEPSDVNDSNVSSCAQEVVPSDLENWMSHMNEDEEWFGLKDLPLAVPVSCDFRHHDAALTYANLLQMQQYGDMC